MPPVSQTRPLMAGLFSRAAGVRHALSLAVCVAGSVLGNNVSANAATLNVPSSYSTIQSALTAATSGDTVIVAPGTYSGSGNVNLSFGGKSLTLQSSGNAGNTVIDCQGSSASPARGFVFTATAATATIQGFTIKNGYFNNGGAVSATGGVGATAFKDCIFKDNTTTGNGGAIFANGANFSFLRCDFINNRASQYGGAIAVEQSQAGSFTFDASACVFRSNVTGTDGSGLDLAASSTLTASVVNCSFFGNSLSVSNASAGTISFFRGITTVKNCIFWGDLTSKEISSSNPPNSNTTITYCDIKQDISALAGTKTNNINSDPKYADTSGGNLKLLSGSPCINTGTSTGAPATDRDGGAWTGGVSIGAYAGMLVVNSNPVAVTDSYSTNEDTPLSVASAQGVVSNDTDAEGQTLSATVLSNVSHGTLNLNSNGSFTYTPASNYNGSDSFTYTVSDGAGGSATGTVNLTVNAVNDNPSAVTDAYNVDEDNVLNVTAAQGVLANDSDIENGTLSATVNTNVTHGTLTLNSDGSFAYTPTANYNGSDSFTYTLSDGAGGSATGTVNLTVNAVNDNPSAVTDTYNVDEDSVLNVAAAQGILANDSDAENGTLSIALDTNVGHGTLTLNSDGSFIYTPASNYNGLDSFTYSLSDGTGGSSTGTVNLTVNPQNDVPTVSINLTPNPAGSSDTLNINADTADVDGETVQLDCVWEKNGSVITGQTGPTLDLSQPNFGDAGDVITVHVTPNDGHVAGTTAVASVHILNSTPVCASVNPAAGSTLPDNYQTLATAYSDGDGINQMNYVRLIANTGLRLGGGVYASYDVQNHLIYLGNDAGTGWVTGSGVAPGTNVVLENSYVKLDVGQTTVDRSGNTVTVNWSVSPKHSLVGLKKLYMYALDLAGANTGWQEKGSWTIVNSAPINVSATPASSSSYPDQSQLLTAVYADADGADRIKFVRLVANAGLNMANGLYVHYDVKNNLLYLSLDSGKGWVTGSGVAPGTNTVLENSYIKLDVAQSSVTRSGDTLTVNLRVIPKNSFTGIKKLYLYAMDIEGAATAWQEKGVWAVTNSAPMNVSVNPAAGLTLPDNYQTLATVYSDDDGIDQMNYVRLLANTGLRPNGGLNVSYDVRNNLIYLGNDVDSGWTADSGVAPGTNVVLENSYVKLDVSQTSVDRSGNTITINWCVSPKHSMVGVKKLYMYALDMARANTGWQEKGSWNVVNSAPVNVSVSPAASSTVAGDVQTLSSSYSDADGIDQMKYVHLLANTGVISSNCMYLRYNVKANLLYLTQDSGSGWVTGSGVAPGTNVVLENSYIKLDVSQTSVDRSGNTITVNWCVSPKSNFTGTKKLFLQAMDSEGGSSPWQNKGTWTIGSASGTASMTIASPSQNLF